MDKERPKFVVYDELVTLTPEMMENLKKFKHKFYSTKVVIDERKKEVDTGCDQETRCSTQSPRSTRRKENPRSKAREG